MATTDAAPPRLADTNVAAYVRARLAAARERGEDFDSAWHGAVAPLRLDEKIGSKGERRLRREWSAALRFARPAFKAAFYGEAAEQGEHAAAALEDMLAA